MSHCCGRIPSWNGTCPQRCCSPRPRWRILDHTVAPVAAIAAASIEHGTRTVLVSAMADGRISVWERSYRSQLGSAPVRTAIGQDVLALAGFPEVELVAVGAHDGSLRLSHLFGDTRLPVLQGGSAQVCALTFGPDAMVAAADVSGMVRVWDHSTGAELWQNQAHRGWVRALEFVGGGMLATGGADGVARLWAADGRSKGFMFASNEEVRGMAGLSLGEAGELLAVGGGRSARVLRVSDQSVVYECPPSQSAIRSIALGRLRRPRGRADSNVIVAIGEASGRITATTLGSAQRPRVFAAHVDAVRALAVGELGGRPILASAADDNQVLLWDVERGEPVDRWSAPEGQWISAAQFAFRSGRLFRGLVIGDSIEIAQAWPV
jgi:WD40 repeat protein